MSTKFSGGRIAQEDIWEFSRVLREKILSNHLILNSAIHEMDRYDASHVIKCDAFHCSLQLFQIDDKYYLRFLSQGYFIENHLEEWKDDLPKSFEQIGIHTGSQSHDEVDELYGEGTLDLILDVLDPMIREHRYFTVVVVDEDVIWDHMWDTLRAKNEQRT
jgi:hypothetical protein